MKKKSLKKLVLTGIATGLLIQAQSQAASVITSNKEDKLLTEMEGATGGNLGYHLYTEEELMLELSPEGAKMFNELSPQGKKLALIVASSRCDGTNSCKGLNACKTDKNECAGKGECKGQGKCALSDKNLAVKLVSEKMAKKRTETMKK